MQQFKFGSVDVLLARGEFLSLQKQREVVKTLLDHYFGYGVALCHTPDGAPFIEGSDRYISISHCGKAVAVAISDRPVGIDVEYRGGRLRTVAHRYFPECTEAHENIPESFLLTAWTFKEAAYKLMQSTCERWQSCVTEPMTAIPFPHPRIASTTLHTGGLTLTVAFQRGGYAS